jgi:hypothetical protein
MKYAIIHPRLGATHVAESYRWAWLARVLAALYKKAYPEIRGVTIAAVTQDPQEIINICDHRDSAIAQRDAVVGLLYNLVSRDDAGRWTTVHPADTPVNEEAAAIISQVLA